MLCEGPDCKVCAMFFDKPRQMTLDEAPGYEVEYFDKNGLVEEE
jgi:hypothetical protein